MKIFNVIYSLNTGGMEKLLVTTANELCKTENVYVCLISERYSKSLVDSFDHRICFVKLRRYKKFRHLMYIWQILCIVYRENIDVIHFHDSVIIKKFFPVCGLTPRRKKFFTIHDTGKFKKIGRINRLIIRLWGYKVIAISDAVAQEIEDFHIPTRKIRRVYNAIDLKKFPVKEKKELGNMIIIGNAARLVPAKKGQDILLRAVALLKEYGYQVECRFAGAQPDGSNNLHDLIELSKQLNIEDNVLFLGNVDDVRQFLEEIHIFVMPSRYEGFGISTIEALSTGTPCVISDVPGLNEIINDERLGEQFISENPENLAEKIICVINKYSQYDPIFLHNYVKDRFSESIMCEELLKVYGE